MRETALDLDVLAQTESLFALSNGHIGLRANLDEGEPFGLPGTYLNSFYELRPLPYAEAGYGYPESGQTIVNVTNGKIIRLLVDDEPFDVRYGQLLAHERDARPARRRAAASRGVAVAGRPGRARPLDAARLVRAALRRGDPVRGRAARAAGARRRAVGARRQRAGACALGGSRAPPRRWSRRSSRRSSSTTELRVVLVHSPAAASSGWRRGWTTWSTGRPGTDTAAESRADLGRVTVAARPRARTAPAGSSSSSPTPGRASARSPRFATRSWPRWQRRGTPAGTASSTGQRAYLDEFWERADVELDGRHRAPAGDALRALPHAPGRCARRAARRSPPRA